jgi:hypothetical protein
MTGVDHHSTKIVLQLTSPWRFEASLYSEKKLQAEKARGFLLFSIMRLQIVILAVVLVGCEILPIAVDPESIPRPTKPPVFDFSYINSNTLQGWIRYRNHCSGIVAYTWHLGIFGEDGKELISNSVAPKIRYPQNGTYHVRVNGIAYDSSKYELALTVEVTNY